MIIYVLEFVTHTFKTCDSVIEASCYFNYLMNEKHVDKDDIEIIMALDDVRYTVDSFIDYYADKIEKEVM